MAIGQIELQGQITRARDFTTVKHNEDTGNGRTSEWPNQFLKS